MLYYIFPVELFSEVWKSYNVIELFWKYRWKVEIVAENNNRAFIDQESDSQINSSFDYSYVHTRARIAVYDDLLSAPRIITI